MTELWRLSAGELATQIRERKVSCAEAAAAALERLDAVNPLLNAVVDCRPDEVMARARATDVDLARGIEPGPLAGVPVTVKVNVDQQGFATTNGTRMQRDLIAHSNSPVVDNLLRAGATILGRTNAPAFSYRWFTDNQLHGRTLNPRDRGLTPGGSSGGCAAATAAGIGHLGHGTDVAGSIRYPAYACGLHGLRPTLGRVPAYNASSPERTIGGQLMAVSGPIARTVSDLRLGLSAMSARDARDPWWVPAPLVGPSVSKVAALCTHPDGMNTSPVLVQALRDAALCLRDAGWEVEELVSLPPIRSLCEAQIRLWLGDGYEAMVAAAEREGDPGAIAVLAGQARLAGGLTLDTFAEALRVRATAARQWQVFLERYAVVLLPVSADLPFPVDLDLQGPQSYARVWDSQIAMVGLPLIGLPSLALTTGSSGNCPVGIQIVASRFREDLCLAVGAEIERRSPRVQLALTEDVHAPAFTS